MTRGQEELGGGAGPYRFGGLDILLCANPDQAVLEEVHPVIQTAAMSHQRKGGERCVSARRSHT